ncbi:hypothetical protein PROFUN_10681 [Planoprotostelium fungivorum]|uniref:Phosphodiesterase n=1 Tax=Planoprotostelium fungivorum TaxID=1890364 RepID=A0A2P6MUZ0_9EUKA|nr:hypothetical protein PROFUN_10681 [Planoprotostelium fungivorum]
MPVEQHYRIESSKKAIDSIVHCCCPRDIPRLDLADEPHTSTDYQREPFHGSSFGTSHAKSYLPGLGLADRPTSVQDKKRAESVVKSYVLEPGRTASASATIPSVGTRKEQRSSLPSKNLPNISNYNTLPQATHYQPQVLRTDEGKEVTVYATRPSRKPAPPVQGPTHERQPSSEIAGEDLNGITSSEKTSPVLLPGQLVSKTDLREAEAQARQSSNNLSQTQNTAVGQAISVPYVVRFNLVKEINALLNATPSFDKEPEKLRLLLIGLDLNYLVIELKSLGFTVFTASTSREALFTISQEKAEFAGIWVAQRLADIGGFDLVPKIKPLTPNVPLFVLVKETVRPEDREKMLEGGAFDCFSFSTATSTLLAHVKTIYESTWLKRTLRALLLKEKEEMIVYYNDPENAFYNQERVTKLENHLVIMENYKKEAQQIMLLLEEEILKLKSELLEQEEELKKLNRENMAGKWRMTALLDKRRRAEANTQNGAISKTVLMNLGGVDKQEMVTTPIQTVTRTVGRLTKVSELLSAEDLRNVLTGIVENLSTSNLYAPSTQVLDQMGLDEVSKNYILSSFTDVVGTTGPIKSRQTKKSESFRNFSGTIGVLEEKVRTQFFMFDVKFDVFMRTLDELSECILVMFDHFNLLEDFGIPINHLLGFVRALQKHYYDNPYHNFQHAFDVAQMCFIFLNKSFLREYLTKTDVLALFVAALCHDLCHPALNNTYQVNAQTELALIYNDNSVLENYHASQAFKLLKEPRNNIFVGLSPQETKDIRKSVISAILATDMTMHFELTSKFSTHIDAKHSESERMVFSDVKDRQLLINVILHSADISNMARPPELSRKWSDLVFKEYLAQGDRERDEGLPVSPFMNRHDTNQAKMSLNFIDYVIQPLFGSVVKCLPTLNFLNNNIQLNRECWITEHRSANSKVTNGVSFAPVPASEHHEEPPKEKEK